MTLSGFYYGNISYSGKSASRQSNPSFGAGRTVFSNEIRTKASRYFPEDKALTDRITELLPRIDYINHLERFGKYLDNEDFRKSLKEGFKQIKPEGHLFALEFAIKGISDDLSRFEKYYSMQGNLRLFREEKQSDIISTASELHFKDAIEHSKWKI